MILRFAHCTFKPLGFFLLAFMLNACGGGGGDETTVEVDNTPVVENESGSEANGTDNTPDESNSDNVDMPESPIENSDLGNGMRLETTDDFSALEGSVVKLNMLLAGVDNSEVRRFVPRWYHSGSARGNTRGKFENELTRELTVELPLVDVETILSYTAELEFRLPGDIEDRRLVKTINITVTDGVPSEAFVIAATGREAPGISGATLASIDLFRQSSIGYIAFSADYRDETNTVGSGIWIGKPDSYRLLLKSGDAITGLPDNSRFVKAESLSISPTGEIAALVSLSGAGTNRAAIVTVGGQSQVILRAGGGIEGDTFNLQVAELKSVHRTDQGAYLLTRAGAREEDLWEWSESRFTPVSLSYESVGLIIPTGAGIADVEALALPFTSDKCFVQRTGSPVFSNSGEVAFMGVPIPAGRLVGGILLDLSEENSCKRSRLGSNSIFRYGNGNLSDVVMVPDDPIAERSGGAIEFPGVSGAGYRVDQVFHLFDDGEVVFRADAVTEADATAPAGTRAPTILRASTPELISVSLVAMTGEALPPAFINRWDRLSELYFAANDDETIGIVTRDSDGIAIYSGSGHSGQPHTSLLSPGSSSLMYVSGQNDEAPEEFADTNFYRSFSQPYIDKEGNMRFFARLNDSEDDSYEFDGLWVTDNNGAITLRMPAYAPVQFGDRQIRLMRPDFQLFEFRVPTQFANSVLAQSDSNGNLLFTGAIDDINYSEGSVSLIYAPVNQP